MKLNGIKVEGPSVEVVVIPRSSGNLIFKCQAVLDYTKFDELVPEPTPPLKTVKGQKTLPDFDDKDYIIAQTDVNFKRFKYMVIESLKATEGLEFDKVVPSDPTTWGLLEQEFRDSGLSPAEIQMIYRGVTSANGMNEEKLQEARASFFAMEQPKVAV